MSYVSKRRTLSEYPLKQVTRGSGLPWEIAKALAPIAMNVASPIASAVGERIGRVISPNKKGSGYKLAGMGRKRRSSKKVSIGGRRRNSLSRSLSSRRSSRRRSVSGGMRRRSSRSRSTSRSYSGGSRRRSSYKKR